MKNFIIILFIFSVSVKLSYCANILVLEGTGLKSHHFWTRSLTEELAIRGHNVTSITGDVEKPKSTNITYYHLDKLYSTLYDTVNDVGFFRYESENPWLNVQRFISYQFKGCEGTLNSKGFHEILQFPATFKFDLIFYEYQLQPCLLGLVHRFDYPPIIAINSHSLSTTRKLFGLFNSIDTHELLQNNFNNGTSSSFFDRSENFLLQFYENLLNRCYVYPQMDEMIQKLIPAIPKLNDLEKKIDLVFVNSNPIFEIAEMILPNVIRLGGMHIKVPKELPDDLFGHLNLKGKGTILLCLGSNMRSDRLSDDIISVLLETIRKLPNYNFVWKYESDDIMDYLTTNLHIRYWIAQNDILAHHKTLLFITHGGTLSLQESIWHGIPILGLPIFGDQFGNIDRLVKAGAGEKLDIMNLTATNLIEMISNLIENKSYRENAVKLSQQFKELSEKPLERAVWWTEWLLRNKNANFLRSPILELNILQKHSIDIILVILVFVLMFFVIFWMLCYNTLSMIRSCLAKKRNRSKNKLKKN